MAQQGSVPSRKRQRSGVWEFFTRFTDGDGKAKADCKRCRLVLGAETTNGTSTLWTHVRICWGDEAAAAAAARAPRPPLPCASSSRSGGSAGRETAGLQDTGVSGDLARMIVLHGYDPSFVEDGYFRSFVRSLNPGFEVPSRAAIEEMCDGIFDEARNDLLSRLRRAPRWVNLAVGRAITPEAGEVVYIARHFVDEEWKLHKMVTDVVVPQGRHRFECGPILGLDVVPDAADYVMDVISEHDSDILSVVYDFSDDDIHRQLKNHNSLCNLRCCIAATYVDKVLHSIARCLLPDFGHFSSAMQEGMIDLRLTRQERLQLLSELDLIDYERAYDEHWCAFYCSLEVLGKRRCTDLAVEGLFVKLLRKVWEQVYRSIQRISASNFPTSNLCLAELLNVREVLQFELARFSGEDADVQDEYDYFDDDKKPEDVLREACNTLDKAIQDSYLVWSVPLALDPRYKLHYIGFRFERAFGSEAAQYVSEVTTEINEMYADYVEEYGRITAADHSDSANARMVTTSVHPWDEAWNAHCRSQDAMAAQRNSGYPETQTELDRYLQEPRAPATEEFDLLNWWKVNSWKYPMVARMARDALAWPPCSKLTSDQLAQVRSILRGYSKKP